MLKDFLRFSKNHVEAEDFPAFKEFCLKALKSAGSMKQLHKFYEECLDSDKKGFLVKFFKIFTKILRNGGYMSLLLSSGKVHSVEKYIKIKNQRCLYIWKYFENICSQNEGSDNI